MSVKTQFQQHPPSSQGPGQQIPPQTRRAETAPQLQTSTSRDARGDTKEALRLAIGSILSQKRPPNSRASASVSGTGTPHHWPSSASGFASPVHPLDESQSRHHPHLPSRLSLSSSDRRPGETTTSTAETLHPPQLPRSQTTAPTVTVPAVPHSSSPGSSGKSTPKAKFIETLQGKTSSAWDALIHGSFSA